MQEDRYLRVEHDYVRASVGWCYDVKNIRTPVRGEITGFSVASRTRMAAYLRSCIADYQFLGTLTCRRYSRDGRDFKARFDRYAKYHLRKMQEADESSPPASRHPASIFWFLEFQRRGAPHIHFFYTHYLHWRKLAEYWAECLHDQSLIKTATKFEKLKGGRAAALSYASKYAAKQDQKDVPEGFRNAGRFWGIRGFRERLAAAKGLRTASAQLLVRTEFKKSLESLRRSGDVRVIPWRSGEGVVIYAAKGKTLKDVGLIQILDKAMLIDSDIRTSGLSWFNRGDSDGLRRG